MMMANHPAVPSEPPQSSKCPDFCFKPCEFKIHNLPLFAIIGAKAFHGLGGIETSDSNIIIYFLYVLMISLNA